MADNIIGSKIVINSDQAVQSVGSVKAQLKAANAELIAMADKFGEGSKEAVNAAKRVAELKDRIRRVRVLIMKIGTKVYQLLPCPRVYTLVR